jgi:spore maturation protein CgeB
LAALDIVVLGLSLTSSWGNGHATTYRALVRALAARGHRVLFLERDVPWYAENRDLPAPPYARVALYSGIEELNDRFAADVRRADLVIVGSYVPQGRDVAAWALATARGVTAFYDIDTPVTVAALVDGTCEYVTPALVPRFDLYLSFTGGPMLRRLERSLGAQRARALYCAFDADSYFPEEQPPTWDLGYMGTYSADRQPALEALLVEPARRAPQGRFIVAGPLYPGDLRWPQNVQRTSHLAPGEHRAFYCRQRFTLNVTRAAMAAAGHSPSVRLFEAAACATPIISDVWPGLEGLFVPGEEIVLARDAADTLRALAEIDEDQRRRLGAGARRRVLAQHTAGHRATELEAYFQEAARARGGRRSGGPRREAAHGERVGEADERADQRAVRLDGPDRLRVAR